MDWIVDQNSVFTPIPGMNILQITSNDILPETIGVRCKIIQKVKLSIIIFIFP